MSRNRHSKATTFYEHLRLALDLYNNPQRLGEESPLAAPYFLGHALEQAADTATGRGLALRAEFDHALEALWGGTALPNRGELLAAVDKERNSGTHGPCYDFFLLDLNYCQQCYTPVPTSQSQIYNDILHISRATHDRHLRSAVKRLGEILLKRLRPSLRLEEPVLPPELIGRQSLVDTCLEALATGQSVALVGAGGIGKTALGATISECWESPAVFWFTIRPTFNDNLSSLLFALGHFLHKHIASTLWLQLVADGGQLKDLNLALGLARSDLENLPYRPLLCIDEVNFLQSTDPDRESPQHTQLLAFIEELSNTAPLLLMGQRGVLEADVIRLLDGLTQTDLAAWLRREQINFSNDDLERLHFYTGGNARLIELCIALHLSASANSALGDTISQLPQSPAIDALWQRLQRRLSTQERGFLWTLSVFRSAVPDDGWYLEADETEDEKNAIVTIMDNLLRRRLIRREGQGGLSLLPALRETIYTNLAIETREELHLKAADIRIERGEYTAAAFHYWRGSQPQRAVETWFAHRAEEIARGQGATALALFEQISQNGLDKRQAQELALLRAELYQLAGKPQRIVETLAQTDWPADDEMGADADLLAGRAMRAQGNATGAMAHFENGLTTLARLHQKASRIYFHRSQTHLHQREMDDAWREAKLSLCQAETIQGNIEEHRGNFVEARKHYMRVLDAAKEANHVAWVANAHQNLGNMAGRQQQIEVAIQHFEETMQLYEQQGDRFSMETTRSNMAGMYIQAAIFDAAIEPAARALAFFQRMRDPYWIALNAANLAEAQSELGLLAEAEEHAMLVFEQEEPHLHPYALFTMGRIRTLQDQTEEAQLYYEQSRQIADMNEDRFLLAYAWRALGEIQMQQQQKEEGRHALAEALTLFHSMDMSTEAERTQQSLCQDL